MIFHSVPQIYSKFSDADIGVKLVDVYIPQIDLRLVEGKDVVARKPFINKNYRVACLKKGRKAIEGFFVRLPDDLKAWQVSTRWAVEAEHLLTHDVFYRKLDDCHGAVTDDPLIWRAREGFEDRMPNCVKNPSPVHLKPRMEVLLFEQQTSREANIIDRYEGDALVSRREDYWVPTVEVSRLREGFGIAGPDRMPVLEDIVSP